MIRAAIDANKKKNVQTSTISFDDGVNQGFAVINNQTGEIISKQTIAASKPKASTITDRKDADTAQSRSNLAGDIERGALLSQLINAYAVSGSGISVEEVYGLYNQSSPYGTAEESLEDVKKREFITD